MSDNSLPVYSNSNDTIKGYIFNSLAFFVKLACFIKLETASPGQVLVAAMNTKAQLSLLLLSASSDPSEVWKEIFDSNLDLSDEPQSLKDIKKFDEFVHSPDFLKTFYARTYYDFQDTATRFLQDNPSLFRSIFKKIDQTQYWNSSDKLGLFERDSDLYYFQHCLERIDYKQNEAIERVNWPHKKADITELKHWLLESFVHHFVKIHGLEDSKSEDLGEYCSYLLECKCPINADSYPQKLDEHIASCAHDLSLGDIKNDFEEEFREMIEIVHWASTKDADFPVIGFWKIICEVPESSYLRDMVSDTFMKVSELSFEDFVEWLRVVGFSEDEVRVVQGHMQIDQEGCQYVELLKNAGNGPDMILLGNVFYKRPVSLPQEDANIEAFNVSYVEPPTFNGNRLKNFLEGISREVASSYDVDVGERILIPIVGLNQSSGFGKSKLFHHPVPGKVFVYVCFRDVSDSTNPEYGYPFKSICADEFSRRILHSAANSYGTEEAKHFVQKAFRKLEFFMARVIHCIKETDDFVNKAEKDGLCFDTDEFELQKASEDVEAVKAFMKEHKDKFKVVLVLDELASLSFSVSKQSQISGYRVLRQILAHSRKFRKHDIDGLPFLMNFIYVCIDTNTTAAEVHPSQVVYASHRMFTELNVSFRPPFVFKSTQDIFVKEAFNVSTVTSWDTYICTNGSFLAALAFGRPLWYSYVRQHEDSPKLVEKFESILVMARTKLDCSKRPLTSDDIYSLSQTLMITTGVVSPTDSCIASELVNSRMAHLHNVSEHGSVSISYISEPVLSTFALQHLGDKFLGILREFQTNVRQRLMSVGSLGEFVSVVLLLYAFSKSERATNSKVSEGAVLRKEYEIFSGNFGSGSKHLYPKSVSSFLCVLLGKRVYEEWVLRVSGGDKGREGDKRRKELLGILHGYVQVSHSVYYPRDERDFNLSMREAIARRAMLKCSEMFPTIDIIIPVVTSSGLVTGIGVSVKRDRSYGMYGSPSRPYKVVTEHMKRFTTKCLPRTQPLVDTDKGHGGDVCSNGWMFVLMSLYASSKEEECGEERLGSSSQGDPEGDVDMSSGEDVSSGEDMRNVDTSVDTSGVEEDVQQAYIDGNLNVAVFGTKGFCADAFKEQYKEEWESVHSVLSEILCLRAGVAYENALEHKGSYPTAVRSVDEYYAGLSKELEAFKRRQRDFLTVERRQRFWKIVLRVIWSIRCEGEYFGCFYRMARGKAGMSMEIPSWMLDGDGLVEFTGHFESLLAASKRFASVKFFVDKLKEKIEAIGRGDLAADSKVPISGEWCGLAKGTKE